MQPGATFTCRMFPNEVIQMNRSSGQRGNQNSGTVSGSLELEHFKNLLRQNQLISSLKKAYD